MAFFGTTIETIESISPIPKADRIEVATLEGLSFRVVVGKGQYEVGDKVIYFPVDSLLPKWILKELSLEGKLSGPEQNRVKSVKLRGQVSQGLIAPTDLLLKVSFDVGNTIRSYFLGHEKATDLTEVLGVEKYQPPVIPCQTADLVALPDGLGKYDIEGAERNQAILELLLDREVEVTEKVEGANFSVTFLYEHGEACVNQRNHGIKPIEGATHDFWKVANQSGLLTLVARLGEAFEEDVTIYGEFIGPGYQNNIYKLDEHEVRVYDIKVGEGFMTPHRRIETLRAHEESIGAIHVPIDCNSDDCRTTNTLREWLGGRTIVEASYGKSRINPDVLREGIVIKPAEEEYIEGFGRLILKQRDPIYLSNTEA